MTNQPINIENWHRRNHLRERSKPYTECWDCQKGMAVCKSKVRYLDYATAEQVVAEIRLRENFSHTISRYWCKWCGGWHLTSRAGKAQRDRLKKAKHKHLFKQEVERRSVIPES